MAEARAILRYLRISPRKVRPLADIIRGERVDTALELLRFSSKRAATPLYKLLRSAVANWEAKNPGVSPEEANLVVKQITVDTAGMLKRWRPVSRGRAHMYRRRMSHVTVVVDSAPSEEEAKSAKTKS